MPQSLTTSRLQNLQFLPTIANIFVGSFDRNYGNCWQTVGISVDAETFTIPRLDYKTVGSPVDHSNPYAVYISTIFCWQFHI